MPEKHRQATSPTGWWIAGLLERHRKPEGSVFWNNYRIIRATHWREAFRRAVELGLSNIETGQRAFSHPQEFVGVTDLVPMYDEFDDGAEVLWQEFGPGDCDSSDLPLGVFTETEMETIYEQQL
jgi:hypothetical protein